MRACIFARARAIRCDTSGPVAKGALYGAALAVLRTRPDLLDRLLDRVSPCPLTGCWWWLGPTSGAGYGRATVSRTHFVAHRLFYALANGVPPDAAECDHRCHQRGCVNPAHLEMVSRAENVRRAKARGSYANNGGARP